MARVSPHQPVSRSTSTLPPFVWDPYPTNIVIGYSYYTYEVTGGHVWWAGVRGIRGCGCRSQSRHARLPFVWFKSDHIGPLSAGTIYYKIYAANISTFGVQPPTVQFGYIGYSTGTTFVDSNIAADFSQGVPGSAESLRARQGRCSMLLSRPRGPIPPCQRCPLAEAPLSPPQHMQCFTANATPTITAGGSGYFALARPLVWRRPLLDRADSYPGAHHLLGDPEARDPSPPAPRQLIPLAQVSTTGVGTGATATATWGVGQVVVTNGGNGYGSTPSVIFSGSGGATATATLQPATNGNPSVCAFFQQRLVLAGPVACTPDLQHVPTWGLLQLQHPSADCGFRRDHWNLGHQPAQ